MECTELLIQEYFKIVDIISSYDDRLLVIKGWGVTFSLVLLATALQKRISALFWVSALSALSFYVLDATYKNYQTNYYPQMRNIEVICSGKKALANTGIDWGWNQANKGTIVDNNSAPERDKPKGFTDTLFNKGVLLPYLLPSLFGFILGLLSIFNIRFRKFMANRARELLK